MLNEKKKKKVNSQVVILEAQPMIVVIFSRKLFYRDYPYPGIFYSLVCSQLFYQRCEGWLCTWVHAFYIYNTLYSSIH